MTIQPQLGYVSLDSSTQLVCVRTTGDWMFAHYTTLEREMTHLHSKVANNVGFGLGQLDTLDTAGTILFAELFSAECLVDLTELEPGLPYERQALPKVIGHALHDFCEPKKPKSPATVIELLARVGCTMETLWLHPKVPLGFTGLTLETLLRSLVHSASWRVMPLVTNTEKSDLDAMPIIALLTLLTGAVIAFLGAAVLADLGTTTYTVNLVVLSFLREFAMLFAVVLMANRIASTFTAQVGLMRTDKEIDTTRALSPDPIELPMLPRVLVLLISLPMLVLIGMLCGIVGGTTVYAQILDIPLAVFLLIMEDGVGVQHSPVGISETPLFTFLIVMIGCLEGFKASGSTQSMGRHTTTSVVHSTFVVIPLNAPTALLFMEMG